ncbi:MAG: YceI family protein [Gammaproteobacteria bacterium]|jgi:polyisoprenoid-binding protein YceI|nr:YceI family protein [Gammaproteobacteria bacterium]MDB3909879.1 YceI family protein [Gammaproteobacteria bacterium]
MFIRIFFNLRRLSLLLICSAFLVSCDRLLTPDFNTDVTELRGGAYTLDPDHATLLWKINHLGFSTFIGRFNDFDATLDFDPENIESSQVEVVINTAGLDINNEEFAEELRGDAWFNVEQFPQAVFRSTSFIEAIDEDSFVFTGDLTLLGVTAPVDLEINFHGGGRNFLTRSYTLGFSASTSFLRSDYGLDRFTSFGVGDEIELEIHVEFMAQ